MTASRNPILAPAPASRPQGEADRRRHGRIRTEDVTCSLGEVADLSISGMRVRRKGRRSMSVGDTFTLTLKYGQFALPVDVRVARIEKIAFRRYIIGLEFEETHPEIRTKLAHLASIAAARRTM